MTPERLEELIAEFESLHRDVESLGGVRHAMQIVRYRDTIAALRELQEVRKQFSLFDFATMRDGPMPRDHPYYLALVKAISGG